jgi:hypothetical protein
MIRPHKRATVQANLILDRFRKTAAMPTYRSRFRSLVTPRSRAGRLRLSAARRFRLLSIFGAMGINHPSCGCGHFARVDGYDIATLETRWTL